MKENRPSITSLAMANMVLILGGSNTKNSRLLLAPGCVESQIELLAACGLPLGGPIASKLICNPFVSSVTRHLADVFIQPHALDGLGFRKSWIEQQVRQSLQMPSMPVLLPAAGERDNQQGKGESDATSTTSTTRRARQLLVVGAGYDTLALRLANEYHDARKGDEKNDATATTTTTTTFWEVDHPSTGRVKERGLRRLLMYPESVKSLHLDLTIQKLSDILPITFGYDCNAPTVVVLEGLTYYLQPDVLYHLFQDIAQVVGPGSRIVFDFFVTSSSSDNGRGRGRPSICQSPLVNNLFLDLVQLVGEPLYFSCGQQGQQQQRRRYDDDDDDTTSTNEDYNRSMVQDLAAFFRQGRTSPYWKVVTPPGVQALGFERLAVVELS